MMFRVGGIVRYAALSAISELRNSCGDQIVDMVRHGSICHRLVAGHRVDESRHTDPLNVTYTWESGRQISILSGPKYLCRLVNSHSLAANPPTRNTDWKEKVNTHSVATGNPTLIGMLEACCCFWKASIISLTDGSNSSVTLRLKGVSESSVSAHYLTP